jgi:nucleoside-diphosphate-sugar epimerase
MPRALIAGCGYVGLAAARVFVQKDWQVSAWTRSRDSAEQLSQSGLDARAVDLVNGDEVRRHAFAVDVVVHCASSRGGGREAYRSIYRDGAANLARVFPDARLIFTSSTSVYRQRDGAWVTEKSAAEPGTETGKILRQAEEIVLRRGGLVLRVAGIYGPGRSFLLRSVLEKNITAPANDRLVNQVHRDDIAAAIFFLGQQTRCAALPPRIFNVVDNYPAPRSEILQWLGQRLEISLPASAASETRRRGASNKRVSNAKLRDAGWQPQYPSYKEGFERSVLPALNSCGC